MEFWQLARNLHDNMAEREGMFVDMIITLLAVGLLMFFVYRGFVVILFAPIGALFAVLLTDPSFTLPFSNSIYGKDGGFFKLYFPVFLLGAIFGKVVEISGLVASIAKTIVRLVAIVLMGAILT